ncbi:MAG: glycosyltransferase family 2 protein [Candidatus Gastranaerophilales bacterium]|nr:glycosyltransferase family 2 protein [Candidatus Gastranaerophilales bacterium]
MKKISIIVPIYNEIDSINEIIEKINNTDFDSLEKEIILVDDASTDGSTDILKGMQDRYKIIFHTKNQGKGAALRTGFAAATGDITIIQDADLEYNPEDYIPLVKAIKKGNADVVYGSRLYNKDYEQNFLKTSLFANKFLTKMTNILFFANLTDMETCYKAFKSNILKEITIKSDRFDFEPEITAKILKKGIKIKEHPISYNGRQYEEGKKITWKDGLHAVLTLIKYRFSD